MKKKSINSMCKAAIFSLSMAAMLVGNSIVANAQPKVMDDGTVFDAEYYAEKYADVVAVYGTKEASLFQHYTDYGRSENREAVQTPDINTFDPVYYAKHNPDVVAVYGNENNNLYQHYLQYGKDEGRKPADTVQTAPLQTIPTTKNEKVQETPATTETPTPAVNSVTLEEAKLICANFSSNLLNVLPDNILTYFDANGDHEYSQQEFLELLYWSIDEYTTTKRSNPIADSDTIAIANDIKITGGVQLPNELYYVK